MAKLVMREGRNVGWEYVIPAEKSRVVMGRRSANEVPILDPKSSRDHAEVLCSGGKFVLRDLKSRNGTLLNETKVAADQDLEYGDRIKIGDTVVEIVDEKADEPITIQLPGYEIMERIGQGGMGTVYRARQLSMDRIVALKVLNDKYSKDEQFIQRFIREARAAGKLSHPNVIHVHDVSEAAGVHYFSMEYVDGRSVKKKIKKDGKIETAPAADIILQAARALEYAHQNGIIHRDIKPDNLMLTNDGVVKLADLGIAKTFDESSSEISTKQRRVYGTPHYMAPEQALGKEMDARADIYSLGASFYHLLTGDTPFRGDTVTDVLKAHIQSNLPAVQEKAPDVPDAYVFIVERMMAKSPEKRYASMSALIEDLEKAKTDRDAEIERLSAGESSVLPAAKRKKKKKKKGADGEESAPLPNWAKAAIAGGVLVGLIILFFITVAIARSFLEPSADATALWGRAHECRQAGRMEEALAIAREIVEKYPESLQAGYARTFITNQQDVEPDGPDVPPENPEEAFAKIKELADADDHAGVVDAAAKFVERFGDAEDLVAKARELSTAAETAMAEKKETDARQALADCDTYANANPDDLKGQLRRVNAVASGFAGTKAAEFAQSRAKRIEDAIQDKQRQASLADFQDARRRADDARGKGDYDTALQAYRTFLAQHSRSREAAEARQAVGKLQKEVEDAFKDAASASDKYFGAASYGEARAALDRFVKAYMSAKWRGQANKKLADIDRRIDALFKRESLKAQSQALAFEHADAEGQYRLLATRYRGTKWSDFSQARAAEIAAEQKIHAELIKRISATADQKRELPFVPPGIPENMAGMKWRIVEATERGMTLAAGRDDQFQRPVVWASWPVDNLLDIFDLYFPKPTAEEGRALSYFCTERNLDARAQQYLNNAGN